MIWIVAIIVLIAIYNAERLPGLMNKVKEEVPHLVEAGKKASQEIKEKTKNVQEKAISRKNTAKDIKEKSDKK